MSDLATFIIDYGKPTLEQSGDPNTPFGSLEPGSWLMTNDYKVETYGDELDDEDGDDGDEIMIKNDNEWWFFSRFKFMLDRPKSRPNEAKITVTLEGERWREGDHDMVEVQLRLDLPLAGERAIESPSTTLVRWGADEMGKVEWSVPLTARHLSLIKRAAQVVGFGQNAKDN